MKEKRSFTGPIVVALALLLLPCLYMGTYVTTVGRDAVSINSGILRFRPEYRIGGDAAKVTFAPIHWLDRQIRRGYWEVQLPNNGAVYERLPYDVLLSPPGKNFVDVPP